MFDILSSTKENKKRCKWISSICCCFFCHLSVYTFNADEYTCARVCVVLTIINCILTETLFIAIWREKNPASWYIQVENYYRMQAHKREEFLQWQQQQQQHLDYDKWWVSIKRWICTSCESIANFTFYSLNSNNVRSWANRLVSKSFYLTKWSPVMI